MGRHFVRPQSAIGVERGAPMSIADRPSKSVPSSGLAAYRAARIGRGNAVVETTRAIRSAILDGVLSSGEWLREESLSKDLGVSRTPLREALNRLEEEGLVQRTPGSGARVATLTAEDMSVVYQVRGSLESMAARAAAQRGGSSAKARLELLHGQLWETAQAEDSNAFNRVNIEFHRALKSMADNAYLARLLSTVETAIRLFGTRTYSAKRMAEVVAEHEAIVAAIVAGDGDEAARAAEGHAARARAATLEWLLGVSDSPGQFASNTPRQTP